MSISILLGILPFVLFVVLMFWRRLTLLQISILVTVVVVVIQIFYWKLVPMYFFYAVVKGFFVAFDIFLIVFGAVFFLEILKSIKVIENVGRYLESISGDYRVQTILLAWFLINFLEGMAGFGTPGAVVAPILISLGIQPLTAVILSLLGNSSAGVFGAAGTPIRVGFSGLETEGVAWYAALYNMVGLLMPVFIVYVLTTRQSKTKSHFWEAVPFALWAGILFAGTSIAVVRFGQEFTSIIGSMLAIGLAILSIKKGIFTPKKEFRLIERNSESLSMPLWKVVLPYVTVMALLVAGKVGLGSQEFVLSWANHRQSYFNPGLLFVFAGVPFALSWGERGLLWRSASEAIRRTWNPFVVILTMSTMIQLMVSSGSNMSGLPSVLTVLTNGLRGPVLPFVTPFLGAFGSFLTGSITISNILFGRILAQASVVNGIDFVKILALGISGAAIGNSMAIADIMAAEAVVGLKDKTRQVIKGTLGPCLFLLVILGVIGLLSV